MRQKTKGHGTEANARCARSYESLKKTDLELSLDEYLAENSTQFSGDSKLAGYYQSRARTVGSPVKKEAPELKVAKRRQTKSAEDSIAVE